MASLFAIIDWDDGYVNDIPISSICDPRLAFDSYKAGDRVQARLPGFPGRHWGVIAAIDGDRKWLKSKCTGPRPLSPRQKELETRRSNDPLEPKDSQTERSNDPKLKENVDTNEKEKDGFDTVKDKRLKRKKLFIDDEAAQAKKSANVRARNTEMARKRTCMETQANLIFPNSNTEVCERLDRLEKKVDKMTEFIEAFLDCRHCLRKAYKEKSIEGPSSTSTRAILVTRTPKHMDHVDLSEQTYLPKSCEKTLPKSDEVTPLVKSHEPTVASLPKSCELSELNPLLEYCEVTPLPKSCDFYESTDSDTQESNWSFVGSPKYNVKVSREVLARCENSAKNLDKLALNLIEVLVSREEAKTASLYGNPQHRKKPLDENKRRALRSHVFSIHGKSLSKEEVEKEWLRLKTPINDKLRKMGRGVYKSL